MAKKYKKIPEVVEAMQFRSGYDNAVKIMDWVNDGTTKNTAYLTQENNTFILTLPGGTIAFNGDYIIRDEKGKFYPIRHEIFNRMYESMSENN